MDGDTMLTDPVTKEILCDPYLASDGETYSRDTLLKAMAADPWHRSPVTYEVLRPYAFPNKFVADILQALYGSVHTCPNTGGLGLQLYEPCAGAIPGARNITWHMPKLLSAEDTIVRRRFGLPDTGFELHAIVHRDVAGMDWLMFPPCAVDMRADVLALAKAVGASKMVQNPWCLSGALVRVDSSSHQKQVEEWWIAAKTRG